MGISEVFGRFILAPLREMSSKFCSYENGTFILQSIVAKLECQMRVHFKYWAQRLYAATILDILEVAVPLLQLRVVLESTRGNARGLWPLLFVILRPSGMASIQVQSRLFLHGEICGKGPTISS